jgi:hypothetical protein
VKGVPQSQGSEQKHRGPDGLDTALTDSTEKLICVGTGLLYSLGMPATLEGDFLQHDFDGILGFHSVDD